MEIIFKTDFTERAEMQLIFTLLQDSGIYVGVKHINLVDDVEPEELDIFISKEKISDVIGALLHLQSKLKGHK
jgi:hypothetical protein